MLNLDSLDNVENIIMNIWENLKGDEEFQNRIDRESLKKIMAMVAMFDYEEIENMSEKMKNEPIVIMAGTAFSSGAAIEYAGEEAKDNETVMRFASENSFVSYINEASDRLKDNLNLVLTAMKGDIYALEEASDEIRNNSLLREISNIEDENKRDEAIDNLLEELNNDAINRLMEKGKKMYEVKYTTKEEAIKAVQKKCK